MKKILDIAFLKIRITLKDKWSVIMMLIAPILFIFILVFGFGNVSNNDIKYPLSIVNYDTGNYSSQLINILENDKSFDIIKSNYNTAKNDIENNKTAMAIVIPKGYSASIENGTRLPIQLIKLQNNESTISITDIISNYIDQIKIGQKTGEETAKTLLDAKLINKSLENQIENEVDKNFQNSVKKPIVSFTAKEVVKNDLSTLSTSAIGFLIMFIMFFVANGAGAILEEKDFGTWNRLLTSPTKKLSTMSGFILGNFLLGWLQIIILILVSRDLFHINWGNSATGLFILFSSFLLAIIGLGTALSSFVKTKAQLSAITSLIVVPTCMIAGCLWPKEIMPQAMIKISNFVPQTWFMSGITNLVTRNSSINSIMFPSTVLMGFAVIFFIMGLIFMGLREK